MDIEGNSSVTRGPSTLTASGLRPTFAGSRSFVASMAGPVKGCADARAAPIARSVSTQSADALR